MKLRRTAKSYQDCKARAVASGSMAQMMYFVEDAKADIATLLDRVEALEKLSLTLLAAVDKAGGTCLGVAVSGKDHPDPDGALMGVFETCQQASSEARTYLTASLP